MPEEKIDKSIKQTPEKLPINQATLDILVANIIPTSKYFEARFDHLEDRVDRMQNDIIDFRSEVSGRFEQVDKRLIGRFQQVDKRFDDMKADVDKRFDDMKADVDKRFDEMKTNVDLRFEQVDQRFEQVDQRFDQVDKRFEQINQRFEQVDKRFEQVDQRFVQMIASIDKLTDKLDHRDEGQRNFTMRMFTVSITISIIGVAGAFLKTLGLI